MGVPNSDVGYTSATTGRGGHEVHKGHVVALGEKKTLSIQANTGMLHYVRPLTLPLILQGNKALLSLYDKLHVT
jgi:hypothetical protein